MFPLYIYSKRLMIALIRKCNKLILLLSQFGEHYLSKINIIFEPKDCNVMKVPLILGGDDFDD